MREKLKGFFNKTRSVLIIFGILAVAGFFVFTSEKSIELIPSSSPDVHKESIRIDKPKLDQLIQSPVEVSGEARGYWFFEASFPIRLYDANNVELSVAVAQAEGEWMTEGFVPFKAKLEFKKPTTETGILVLEKDNPSGLPENADELRISVRFDLGNWSALPTSSPSLPIPPLPISGSCRVTGCSGQICSDEEVITTCEFKEEYACYKTATCEKQEDDKCGWTPTEELVICLSEVFKAEAGQ